MIKTSVYGLGGIGNLIHFVESFNILFYRNQSSYFTYYDFDKIEISNLNRFLFISQAIRNSKGLKPTSEFNKDTYKTDLLESITKDVGCTSFFNSQQASIKDINKQKSMVTERVIVAADRLNVVELSHTKPDQSIIWKPSYSGGKKSNIIANLRYMLDSELIMEDSQGGGAYTVTPSNITYSLFISTVCLMGINYEPLCRESRNAIASYQGQRYVGRYGQIEFDIDEVFNSALF